MSKLQGHFVWYELTTTDPEAAGAFYGEVIGWTVKDAGPEHPGYSIFNAGERGVGGMMALPVQTGAGACPAWVGYVGVDDVDAMVPRLAAAGGAVHRGPADIPGVGRFAVVADPHGAVFVLFRPGIDAPEPPPPAGATPGRIGWHELHAGEREAAFAFYAALFGWTRTQAIDMGPDGIYQTFAVADAPDGQMTGGMMTRMAVTPRPVWLFYVNVPHIDAAVTRLGAAGGTLLHGPVQVPGGSWVVQCRDPQGAIFAMVGAAR